MSGTTKEIDLSIDNFDAYFTRDFAASLVVGVATDDDGSPYIPNESHIVTELVRWVGSHNTDAVDYHLDRVTAAMILAECC